MNRVVARVFNVQWCLGALTVLSLNACVLDRLVKVDDPDESEVINRDKITTYAGALGLYYSAVGATAAAMNAVSEEIGLFTDELTYPGTNSVSYAYIDARFDKDGVSSGDVIPGIVSMSGIKTYEKLQTARIRAAQAAEVLLRYGNDASHPLVGNAYALEGLVEVVLAEVMCSGIPLTRAPFEDNFQYTRGFTTAEVLRTAVAHFDTALDYAADSLAVATLARVGKARALLGLGEYDSAAAAVADVPTTATYMFQYSGNVNGAGFWTSSTLSINQYRVLNNEGINGIVWAASTAATQDPRVPLQFTNPLRQAKFTSATVGVTIASGIEARLIEAEALLQPAATPRGDWLAKVNEARHTQAALADTTDPGTADGRINLLFRERAFWFYLTGHRLGDLRRLVREYGRPQQAVFPTGPYLSGSIQTATYGTEVVFVPPATESDLNPLYDGCVDRNA